MSVAVLEEGCSSGSFDVGWYLCVPPAVTVATLLPAQSAFVHVTLLLWQQTVTVYLIGNVMAPHFVCCR